MKYPISFMGCLLIGCQHGNPSNDETATDSAGEPPTDTPSVAQCVRGEESIPIGVDTCVDEAPCQWVGEESYAYFGYSLDAGHDVNGDGFDDIVVGAPMQDFDTGEGIRADAGLTTVWSAASIMNGSGGPHMTVPGANAGDYAGTAVVLLGDINGDGLADILTGARGSDEAGEEAGSALLILGHTEPSDNREPDVRWTGEQAYARAGTTVAAANDVNGDGLADLLIAGNLRTFSESTGNESYAAGTAHLIFGAPDIDSSPDRALDQSDVRWTGESDGDALGLGLARGGDLNGDGYADPVMGAPYAASSKGRVYAWSGSPHLAANSVSDAPVQLDGDASYDAFGWSMTTGDLNGDGLDDLVVGAPLSDRAWDNAGAVSIYMGAPDFFEGTPTPQTVFVGEVDDHQLGTGLLVHSDINGDGQSDLVMGAVSAWRNLITKGGRTVVASGPVETWPDEVSAAQLPIQIHGAAVKDYLGRSAAAADVDGDGLDDLLLGSAYTNTNGYDSGSLYLFWGQ